MWFELELAIMISGLRMVVVADPEFSDSYSVTVEYAIRFLSPSTINASTGPA
jgi:hypothetical protein